VAPRIKTLLSPAKRNFPRACGRTRIETPGGPTRAISLAIVCMVGVTGPDEWEGRTTDTPRSYDATRSCAGAVFANHSMVRRSPSRSGTTGDHPNEAWAFP